MKDKNGAKARDGGAWRVLLALVMLALAASLLYRGRGSAANPFPPEEPETTPPAESALPIPQPEETAPAEIHQEPVLLSQPEEPSPEPKPKPTARPIVYDARSYQLVTDMVYAFRYQLSDRERIIADDVEALKAHDPALGELWGGIMDYWDYADFHMELNYERLPEDLPDDDSLCIVVLGFQLEPDGNMAPELLGRCELALQAAQQYPNAFVAVTGGGTALKNEEATEAGVMAKWFVKHGLAEERLILEDRSSTTEENAVFTRSILTEDYPQVKSLVIVTSDYHVPLGSLMFTEAALLYGCAYGETPFAVVSNLALRGYALYEYKNPQEQAIYVWAVADPDGARLTGG